MAIDWAAIAAAGGIPKVRPAVLERKAKQRAKATAWKKTEKTEIKCLQCGRIRSVKPSWGKRQFCERDCRTRWRNEERLKKTLRECIVCGKSYNSRVVGQETCSPACGYVLRKTKLRPSKACPNCGVKFWPVRTGARWRRHCSKRCSVQAMASKRVVHGACAQCNKPLRRYAGRHRKSGYFYCSRECQGIHFRGENNPVYRGTRDPNRGSGWARLAKAIRLRDGHTCRRCGTPEAENGRTLHVDHLIPWRAFADKRLANDPDNLVSLCVGCHGTKTHTVESRWLRGDRVGFLQFCRSLNLPSAVSQSLQEKAERVPDVNWRDRASEPVRRTTHCPMGHEYTPENSLPCGKEKRSRACRTCLRDRARKWRNTPVVELEDVRD